MIAGAVVLAAAAGAVAGHPVLVDDFVDVSRWSAAPAAGVSLTIGAAARAEGHALRLDFDFHGQGGYAIARRALDLALPENYEFSFSIRGQALPNDLEFKLVDPSGENVWWNVHRGFEVTPERRRVVIKKRQLVFAWGPDRATPLTRAGALEFAITAGSGGRGTVWIDDLVMRPLPPEHAYTRTPRITASASARGARAEAALDSRADTAWTSGPAGEAPVDLVLDFLESRELGGLVVDWTDDRATDYDVDASDDGVSFRTLRSVRGGYGGRDWLRLPETETRFLRLRMRRSGRGAYGVREIEIRPLAFGETSNAFFGAIASASERGAYPRYLLGQQVYWTVVGVSGGDEDVLISEDGAIETGKGGPSLEPFVVWNGRRVDWAGAARASSLLDGDLPVPTVTWTAPDLTLEITAFADGPPEAPTVRVRYRLTNRETIPRGGELLLALRPFQVDPPWQFLGTPGGVSPISRIRWDGVALDTDRAFAVIPVTPPVSVTMLPFDAGDVVARWAPGARPAPVAAVDDPSGYASAGLWWDIPELRPGASWETAVSIPLGAARDGTAAHARLDGGIAEVARRLTATRAAWREALSAVEFRVPAGDADLVRTLRTNLAYTLVNRHGRALQPGSRAYARSWIRDGALMASALLRLGHPDEARAFAESYAPYQYADGKVPCCVDSRGADPVPENDSHGELIHLISEVSRYTGDRDFLERMWPHVSAAVAAIDALRQERRGAAYRAPDKTPYFGLLPESISHEGYSDKPRHSYWDDFFAMTGLFDAARIAGALGRESDRARIGSIRDEFQSDLLASIGATMKRHGIDTLPGCVELGDFDPASSTVALDPAGLLALLPPHAAEETFRRYHDTLVARRDGTATWESYTPYEVRAVGAFVRLGWSARARDALAVFLSDRRPPGWNAWAEVVWHDPLTPRFVGDIPHTWVGTDFIRAFLDLFAYEMPREEALVVAAGIPEGWARDPAGVGISRLRTPWGPLSWSMRGERGELTLHIEQGIAIPPGGIRFRPPGERAPSRITLNGAPVAADVSGAVTVRSLPADVRVIY